MGTLSAVPHAARVPSIRSRLRYDPKSAVDLTREEIEFAAKMKAYLSRWNRINSSCGEILDVAMDLGYENPDRNFERCVRHFTTALHKYKKEKRRPHPLWSEVLSVMAGLGWKKADAK